MGHSSEKGGASDPTLIGPEIETVEGHPLGQGSFQLVGTLPRAREGVLPAASTDKDKAVERDPPVVLGCVEGELAPPVGACPFCLQRSACMHGGAGCVCHITT